jgi:hypothetical protein
MNKTWMKWGISSAKRQVGDYTLVVQAGIDNCVWCLNDIDDTLKTGTAATVKQAQAAVERALKARLTAMLESI